MLHYTGSPSGAMYGAAFTPERGKQSWLSSRTEIPGLYLTGADALSPGVVGAMMGGIKTAGAVAGFTGFFRIMSRIMREAAKGGDATS